MVNVQEYIDKEYPKGSVCRGDFDQKNSNKRRKEITELDISDKNLEGILKLEGFYNLKKLNCSKNKLTKLDLDNLRKLEYFNCEDNQISHLEVSRNKKMVELICSGNKLTNLELSGLEQLEKIECVDNNLSNFDYSFLNPDKLTYLNVSDNDLSEQDLMVFGRFANLETL